jgi:hypothetical protein
MAVQSQDAVEMETHVNMFFAYDFVLNLITLHVCPDKYLYKHIHKCPSASCVQNGHLP